VVRQVRHASGVRRVGHGGTLDPLASGVLPVCLGEATKLAPFLLGADKEYDVTIRLGVETDTDDSEGAVTATCDPGALSAVTAGVVGDALGRFRGPIEQAPPAYAAIKRDGRPLYSYARAGESIEVAARAVVIHALEMTHFGGPGDVRLHVHCSKGTYVRALARDLGAALGVGGHLTALRRTRVGPFTLGAARTLDELASLDDPVTLPLAEALRAAMPVREVTDDEARSLSFGKALEPAGIGGTYAALAPDGSAIALLREADDSARPVLVFAAAG
jgi:tRNA pseudouridine55 synthase